MCKENENNFIQQFVFSASPYSVILVYHIRKQHMYADIQINFPCNRFTDNSDFAFWASDQKWEKLLVWIWCNSVFWEVKHFFFAAKRGSFIYVAKAYEVDDKFLTLVTLQAVYCYKVACNHIMQQYLTERAVWEANLCKVSIAGCVTSRLNKLIMITVVVTVSCNVWSSSRSSWQVVRCQDLWVMFVWKVCVITSETCVCAPRVWIN